MKSIKVLMMLTLALIFAACSSEEPNTPEQVTVGVQLVLPKGIDNGQFSDLTITFTEVNTGKQTKISVENGKPVTALLTVGQYRAEATGKLTYKNARGLEKHINVKAVLESLTVTGQTRDVNLQFFSTTEPEPDPADYDYKGFVLAEIFCAGTSTPQGRLYNADTYFVIYNNTDHVLYADSLVIAESDFLTVSKQNYTPDIMATDMAVAALYMIPGSGHDVPVQPGGKLLIVNNALDHTKANPNSWDESTANYEWYDESTNPNFSDVDNENVPNLVKIYCYTKTIWSLHTQGFKSYALGRMHTSIEKYLTDYVYNYNYHIVAPGGEADMTGKSYKLPNNWILDAVNMSAKTKYQWSVVAPNLDAGFTYSSEIERDGNRFKKSVRRKVVSRDGSRAILMDTNNSTDDFEPQAGANPFHQF